jgi:isobutyryl-CoA mutase
MDKQDVYTPQNKIRIVTAASLFDGHDAAINIMRRILQASGAEVIHLGHDRSAQEVVECAISEDVNAIAMTSYQGGHNEYFRYMHDLLKERGCGHIKIFGGGGGVILPTEIAELQAYGIERIYSPDDGRALGLQGMINDLLQRSDFPIGHNVIPVIDTLMAGLKLREPKSIARLITAAEYSIEQAKEIVTRLKTDKAPPVLGVTGTGGSGKSSLVDELVRRFLYDFKDKTVAIVSVDPSKRRTGGALLGDRIRMNAISNPRVYMRSLATRQANLALARHMHEVLAILKAAQFDLIILETSGIGQSDTEIMDYCDLALYVMTPEYGAATQLEKIDMLDYADVVALNKFDKRGGLDALRDVKKQYKRNHNLWSAQDDELPVYGSIASQFNDPGTSNLYRALIDRLAQKTQADLKSQLEITATLSEKIYIIPPERVRYLSDISETIREYNRWSGAQSEVAQRLYSLNKTIQEVPELAEPLKQHAQQLELKLENANKQWLDAWPKKRAAYTNDVFTYHVRGKPLNIETHTESLSHQKIPKIALPSYQAWGDLLRWHLQENVPGEFPYTAGVFPFKREQEDPTRMFAGEGGPERTNRRFHYLSRGLPAKRLSTAFDSVTLYGADPDHRPDIYGKIGNAGVSICTVDDAKKLYSGFNLADPATSVSMTINGPAPMLVGFFMNAAIDQQCEIYIQQHGLEKDVRAKIANIFRGFDRSCYRGDLPQGNNGLGTMLLGVSGDEVLPRETYEKIKADTLAQVRGTVQADILKEDQAQNTCIFSTEFALRMMGDIQAYFIENQIRNFYSVSISGYHIAEAGANPLTQLAFTLANGFTYVEYYLSRGLDIDDFAPNLSFFFSNGLDPEYVVLGRVARRIWAKAMKQKYRASARSQMLKYHVQTSGRSLHAQEIAFNDIRTTLQAVMAIFDNCNSLHTNAFDEAITTPTQASVRRAMAIQMIINHELGWAKNQNPLQGSFIVEELTALVEEAVLLEFERLTERGGVLGAMETMYQRSKIQEESMHYEMLKHSGKFPVIGVNTFLADDGSPTVIPEQITRATTAEKEAQIAMLSAFQKRHAQVAVHKLDELQKTAMRGGNIFSALMDITKFCSLGQISQALYEVGGQYRRNM